jgi:hypothetical protein
MSENNSNTDLLIKYLDGELDEVEMASVKKNIESDPALREELDTLRLAKEAVTTYGMHKRIQSIHPEMMHELKENSGNKPGITRMIFQYGIRAAAVLIALFGISIFYQYYSSTPEKLFDENFHPYDLRVTRGSSNSSLEDLYEKGDMSGLINRFNQLRSPQAADYFLAGNAYLNIHRPDSAIIVFLGLQNINQTNHTHYFEEDTEYFLALSYLSNREPAKALPLFEKIHADPNHPFHSAVSAWFLSRLKRSI